MKVKIACCQIQSGIGKKQENIEKMITKIEEIMIDSSVELIVFPELATTGYECGPLFAEVAEFFPEGKTIEIFCNQARKHNVHIVFGFVEKLETINGVVLYNAAAIIDNSGNPIGIYRKSHLVDGEETKYFKKGTEYPVFETSIGKIGIMICWDMAFPEVARILALKGAEIIVAPAAWETEPHRGDWDIVNTARSFDNVVYLASCNQVGKEKELDFFGRSKISGPLGRPIVEANDGEEYIKAEVDLSVIPELREGYYVLLKDRNPETYMKIVEC